MKVFGHLPFVLIYFDDILIFCKTEEKIIQHLEQVSGLLNSNEPMAALKMLLHAKRD